MQLDFTVQIRNAALARIMQVPLKDLSIEGAVAANAVGEWQMVVNPDATWAPLIQSPGAGIVITRTDGLVLLSGPMTSWGYEETPANPHGTLLVKGVTDEIILKDRIAYPNPAVEITAQDAEADVYSGNAAEAISYYVDRNLGALALGGRKHPYFSNEGGGTAPAGFRYEARFETLLEIAQAAAGEAGAASPTSPLVFAVKDIGGRLSLRVHNGTDRRDHVRLSMARKSLAGIKLMQSAPEATVAVVGGEGDGAMQEYAEFHPLSSGDAIDDWGRRIESFVDAKGGTEDDAMRTAGIAHLASAAAQQGVNLSPTEHTAQRYGIDWNLGDLVRVELSDGSVLDTTVTGFAFSASASGVYLGMQVSDTPAVRRTPLAASEARLSRIERRF